MRVYHLMKTDSNYADTACGRSYFNTPFGLQWEEFKESEHKCARCEQSKFAAYLERQDQKELDAWEPVSEEEQEAIIAAECAAIRKRA